MASIGMAKSQAQSQQASGFRGTGYEGEALARGNHASTLSNDWATQVRRSPSEFQGQTGRMLAPGGIYGMGEAADKAVGQFGVQAFNFASAQGANAGRLTPEGAAGVAGDAMTMILPQLIPQISDRERWQTELAGNLNTQTGNILAQNASVQSQGTGSQGSANSNSFSFNAGVANNPKFG